MKYTISLKMRSNKISGKTQRGPVYLKITKDRKTCYISTGYHLHVTEWNGEAQKVLSKHSNSVRMNMLLSSKIQELWAIALRYEDRRMPFTAQDLKEAFCGGGKEHFIQYANEVNERRLESDSDDGIKLGTYIRYQSVVRKLSDYIGHKNVRLLDITSDFLNNYKRYLKNELKNRPNTINSNLRCIRCIINLAKKDGLLSPDANPFAYVSMPSEDSSRGFLTSVELDALERVDLIEGSKMDLHRDMFLFAASAAGIRIADLLLLRRRSYDGEYLHYKMRKNGKDQRILLPTKAKQIIDKYVSLGGKDMDEFIFPAIKLFPKVTQEEIIFRAISSATAYVNKDLKIIASKAGIDKRISFHVSRHSFGTHAITKQIPLETVAQLMGHSDSNTTRIYAKWTDQVLDQAMRKFDL